MARHFSCRSAPKKVIQVQAFAAVREVARCTFMHILSSSSQALFKIFRNEVSRPSHGWWRDIVIQGGSPKMLAKEIVDSKHLDTGFWSSKICLLIFFRRGGELR